MNIKTQMTRWIAAGTLSALILSSAAILSTPAHATGSKTWKKVAIGSAAVTGYGLIRHKGRIATAGAVATGASYYMYKHKKHKEQHTSHYHHYRHH